MSFISRGLLFFLIISAIIFSGFWIHNQTSTLNDWSTVEIRILQSLWIGTLPPVPNDPSNIVADDAMTAQLGHQLFFDTRFSTNGNVSCASCHKPELHFTDGLKLAVGVKTGIRNSMSLVGTAYNPWFFWDGRRDSLWAQALTPLENSLEHAGTRMQYVHLISQDDSYRAAYEKIFGTIPDFSDSTRFPKNAGPVEKHEWNQAWQSMSPSDKEAVSKVFVNIGKSIAAYERKLLPGPSRFDNYVEEILNSDTNNKLLTHNEIAGLKLFIGKAQCINCHNGPLFTNNEFHNTSILSSPGQVPSMGRVHGVRTALNDPFNCLGKFSDASKNDCAELRFTRTGDELIGTHKTPSLRNVADTAPYMHAGQLNNLSEVLDHYNRALPSMIGHNEAKPLNLNQMETQQIEAFLHTLSGSLATDAKWLSKPSS